MYRLSENFDVSFFLNLELIQVRIGTHQVQFVFESDVILSVESNFSYQSNAKAVEWRPEAVEAAAAVVKLLGHNVTTVEKLDEKTLRLQFSNGDSLQVTDDSDQYESFTISLPGKTIVV